MTVRVQPLTLLSAENILIKLHDAGLLIGEFVRREHNKLLRLTTEACEEFDLIVEEINAEIRR